MFILFLWIHNINGDVMKKIFFSFLIFMFFIDVHAGQVFVSKRDSDTGDFLVDCDFLLYDQYENIVDSWIQGSSSHILNLPRGSYRLVERPFVMGNFRTDLGKTYILNVENDESFEFKIFNKKIETPRNLGFKFNSILGFVFVFIGVIIVSKCCKFSFF